MLVFWGIIYELELRPILEHGGPGTTVAFAHPEMDVTPVCFAGIRPFDGEIRRVAASRVARGQIEHPQVVVYQGSQVPSSFIAVIKDAGAWGG